MLISKDTIREFADADGIGEIDEEGYRILAQDIEYRIKEVCQEAAKFMHASHRSKLCVSDVNNALISRNLEPLFGYDSKDILVFKGLQNNSYYVADEEINLEEFLQKSLPRIPLRPYIQSHWLVLEGIQPSIQQNPIVIDKPAGQTDSFSNYQDEMILKKQVKHRLTKELNMYYEKILQVMESDPDVALNCLENETGIQQLVPYFIHHFNAELKNKITDEEYTKTICLMYYSLFNNKFLFIDPYLHEMIPSVITCVIGKSPTREVRLLASDIVKYIYDTYGYTYHTLAPRIINTLLSVYKDDSKTEESQWAALYCLSKLSNEVIENNILSNPCLSTKESGIKSEI